ncbi:MAG: N-acetyltransferase [Frankia sp.]|nr:N-acetyltransferase [Frankia sp.]
MCVGVGERALVDNTNSHRFELTVDGALAALVTYSLRPAGVITFLHTETEPAFEGQGLGGAVARGVLDDARRRGLLVRPACPFIRGWISRHPEYADLVDPDWTAPADPA